MDITLNNMISTWTANINLYSSPVPENLDARRLRIGYLASNLREQPTAGLLNGLVRYHDNTKVELFIYSGGGDEHFENTYQIASLSDKKAAELIRSHKIDILIELNGYIKFTRMGILSYRPAPVQIDYVGFPGSVGGIVADYVIADSYTVPKNVENRYPKKVIKLHQTYQVNDYAFINLAKAPIKSLLGLPKDDVKIIGMFNAINKVRAGVWTAWMQILKNVPNSILWILETDDTAKKNITQATVNQGVEPSRIKFASYLKQSEHLSRIQCCDLILAPWSYEENTSVSDSIFAGVPVIVLEEKDFVSRVSGSLLKSAGLQELIQPDIQSYINLATNLLKNDEQRKKIKDFINDNKLTLDIFDTKSKVMYLEKAYEAAIKFKLLDLPFENIVFQPDNNIKQFKSLKKDILLIIDPGTADKAGHHQPLNESILQYIQLHQINYYFLINGNIKTDNAIQNVFTHHSYVSGKDWLDWFNRSTVLANNFSDKLDVVVQPYMTYNKPKMLFHSITFPLFIGLVHWLESLNHFSGSIGIHFHIEPTFGINNMQSIYTFANEIFDKFYKQINRMKIPLIISVQHELLIPRWQKFGAKNIQVASTPVFWKNLKRKRPVDERIKILFIGAPRLEKGFGLLVSASKTLLKELPNVDLRFVCSVSNKTIENKINSLANDRISVLTREYIETEEYYKEIVESDVVFCAYLPDQYANKSSQIFCEAQALGVPTLIMSKTASVIDMRNAGNKGSVIVQLPTTKSLVHACKMVADSIQQHRQDSFDVKSYYIELLSGKRWFELHI